MNTQQKNKDRNLISLSIIRDLTSEVLQALPTECRR